MFESFLFILFPASVIVAHAALDGWDNERNVGGEHKEI